MSVELLELIQKNYGMTEEELRELALRDSYFFCKAIAGFTRLTVAHQELCKIYDNPEINRVGNVQPRATGKSSTAKGKLLQHIVLNPNVRILYVSKTLDRAAGAVDDLRKRILGQSAPLLPALFPHIVPKHLREDTWSTHAFTVPRSMSFDESTVEAAGIGTNKTGLHYDIIFFDDPMAPTKDNLTATGIYFDQTTIDKTVGYMQLASAGMLDSAGPRLIYLAATRYAVNDVVAWAKANWKTMVWYERSIRDKAGTINYPTFWDEKGLGEEKRKGSIFYLSQFENIAVDPEQKPFKLADLQSYAKAPTLSSGFVSITVDPAQGKEKKGNSKTAILASLTSSSGDVYALDYRLGFIGPKQTVLAAIELAEHYDADVIGVESVGYQASIESYLKEEMRRKGRFWTIDMITRSAASKNARIYRIQPVLENHALYAKEWMHDLRSQLDDFPFGKKDLLDTLADHIHLSLKHSGRLSYLLRAQTVKDRAIRPEAIPEGKDFASLYIEETADVMDGFIVEGTLGQNGKLYVTKAFAVVPQDPDWLSVVKRSSGLLIVSPKIYKSFLRAVPGLKTRRKVMMSSYPANSALANIACGDIVLVESVSDLAGSSAPAFLSAVQLLYEGSAVGETKVLVA